MRDRVSRIQHDLPCTRAIPLDCPHPQADLPAMLNFLESQFVVRSAVTLVVLLLPAMKVRAETWEEKKAARFKPLSENQKQSIAAAIPNMLAANSKAKRRILVFYRCEGFIHTSIPHANECIRQMSEKSKAFDVDFADTYEVFTRDNLAQYDAVLLNNTTGMRFEQPQARDAFLDFVSGGKGLIGFHAASDNFKRHPECSRMVGGIFAGHPWGAGGNWAFKLDDPDHVLNAAFNGKGFWHTDEIYQYNPDSYVGTSVLRILVSLDMSKEAVYSRINDGPREVPVSWIRNVGKGRLFYTNFGHREDTFANPMVVKHMLDGIQFALGDLKADATPTDQLTNTNAAPAPEHK